MPTPEQQRQYDELVSAIVKVVPSVERKAIYPSGHTDKWNRPITLEDVARWIRDAGSSDLHDCPDGGRSVGETLWDIWDLGKPLSDQSDECKKFLHSILL